MRQYSFLIILTVPALLFGCVYLPTDRSISELTKSGKASFFLSAYFVEKVSPSAKATRRSCSSIVSIESLTRGLVLNAAGHNPPFELEAGDYKIPGIQCPSLVQKSVAMGFDGLGGTTGWGTSYKDEVARFSMTAGTVVDLGVLTISKISGAWRVTSVVPHDRKLILKKFPKKGSALTVKLISIKPEFYRAHTPDRQ